MNEREGKVKLFSVDAPIIFHSVEKMDVLNTLQPS